MVFDSLPFFAFFAVFLTAYWLLTPRVSWQNALILAGSYVFYGWWNWRFLGLIVLSSAIDYFAAQLISRSDSQRRRRLALTASLLTNLGTLCLFKYYDFFAESLHAAVMSAGLDLNLPLLEIALPVGISFYTFQSMAYTIDVYRGQARAESNALIFFGYISFFPQLVAGPIERASHLLPQFRRVRTLSLVDAQQGIWLMTWGFFLKLVIANGCEPFVSFGFRADQPSGWTTILAGLLFSIQIYADFNGYSCIAKGAARLLGFDLMWNFNAPYLSTSISEFWTRWHISLSTWLRDYLYIPLGGSRCAPLRRDGNLMVTMVLGGLWHGAAWNFVLWGGFHGVALIVCHRWRQWFPTALELPRSTARLLTLAAILFGWILFRVKSMPMLVGMLASLSHLQFAPIHLKMFAAFLIFATITTGMDIAMRNNQQVVPKFLRPRFQYAAVTGVMWLLCFGMFGKIEYQFSYFQF